jgi:hypothetical protein
LQLLAGKEQQNVTEDPGQRYRIGNCVVDRQKQRAASRVSTYDGADQRCVAMIKGYLQFATHLAGPADAGVPHPQRNAGRFFGDEVRISANVALDMHPQKQMPALQCVKDLTPRHCGPGADERRAHDEMGGEI